MKTSIASLVVVGALTGCQPQVEMKSGSVSNLSNYAKLYLRLSGTTGMMSGSRQHLTRRGLAKTMRKPLSPSGVVLSGGRVPSDSIYSANPRCGIDTLIHNMDGSSIEITDYGDSCVYYYNNDAKVVYWGKSTSTYKYTGRMEGNAYVIDYFVNSRFKNYGGKFVSKDSTNTWNSNGTYLRSGTSIYDTLLRVYAGSSESSDSSAFGYNGELYLHLQSAKDTFDSKTSVQLVNDDQYVRGDNFYHSVVTVPVVRDYTCNPHPNVTSNSIENVVASSMRSDITIPVSGHEVVNYQQDGKTGAFEIDYGNGECDTLVTIIEDGKSVIVDMAGLYRQTPGS